MVILAMLLCVGIAAVGYKMRAWPVTFVSSIGWVIIAMRLFQETQDYLAMALMLMLAIAQVFLIKSED